ncbi:MAG TPA: hypothetical protein VGK73_16550 [Polyangiaceae bacterium]
MEPKRIAIAAVGAVLVVAFLAHAAYYHPFLSDDALISLRYAKRWMTGHGLTWTDGERVEGYTNFLWVILSGIGGGLGFGYITSARALGVIGGLAALFAAGFDPARRALSVPRWCVGGGLLVTSAPLAIWAVGGLEQTFMAGLLALALRGVELTEDEAPRLRRLLPAGVAFAALALTRADGFVLVGAALAAVAVAAPARRTGFVRAALLAWPSLVALVLQLGFRLAYYGDFQPNTARVKLALTTQRLSDGGMYVLRGERAGAVVLALALVASALALRRGAGRKLVVPWAVTLVWLGYVGFVGGDIFPGFRQLVPALVPLCLLCGDEAEALWSRVRQRPAPAFGALFVALGANGYLQFTNGENQRAKAERWEWDGLAMGRTLRAAFGEQRPLHAIDAAGALPFWSELPSLDMLGLNDRHIARTRSKDFGKGFMGHELGDGAYVFRRKPDLITFNWPAGTWDPELLSGRQLLGMPEFRATYQWIRVAAAFGNRAIGEIWVRREGGKLGVVRNAEGIQIPGYFLTGQESPAAARLNEAGRLAAELSLAEPGVLPAIELPAGRFRLELLPPAEDALLDLRCDGTSMRRLGPAGAKDVVFELEHATPIGISLAPPRAETSLTLATVRFVRVVEPGPTFACSDGPLHVSASDLPHEPLANAPAAHPRHRLFGKPGLVLELGQPGSAHSVEIGLSPGSYQVELRQDSTIIASRRIREDREKQSGVQRFDLDRKFSDRPSSITIRPNSGRGKQAAASGAGARHSLTHVKLSD